MRIFPLGWSSLLLASCLFASAQTAPKLALGGVEVAPTLAKKIGYTPADTVIAPVAAPSTPVAAPAPLTVVGVWTRSHPSGARAGEPGTLTITKTPDGAFHAEWRATIGNRTRTARVTSITGSVLDGTGNHLNVVLGSPYRVPTPTMTLDLNADFTAMTGQWGTHHATPLTLIRSGAAPALGVPAVSANRVSSVGFEDLLHSMNVQLFDRFNGENLFSVIGEGDLKQMVPPAAKGDQQSYDLKNPDTMEQFKKAGIDYMLVTTLEGYQDQTLDVRRTQGLQYQTQISAQSRSRGNSSSAATQTQGGISPEMWQRQIITLNVRCQIFEVATGQLKKSANSSFPLQRDFLAVAQGRNELSTADLFAAAAQKVSEWATSLVDDSVFPIEVLAKKDNLLTISRGQEAGLKVGQVFLVTVDGDEIKDPHTGKLLGRDLKTVGRASITELQPKFSKARILEDTGIVNGAALTRLGLK